MQSWIHVIEWRANVRPELTALVDDRGAAYTYAQLRAETERRAGGWAGLGVGSGDVVAVVAKNSADFLLHAFALMRAGATPAFVNWRLSPRELAEVLALVEPKAIAADAEFAGLVEAAWPEPLPRVVIGGGPVPEGWLDGAALSGLSGVSGSPPRPALTGDTVLALVHTSGTTGRAKAIPLRHGALMMSVADFAIEIGDQVAGSHHLQILPLFHLGGFGQCMQAILTAGTVYIHTAFNPAAVIDAIEADRIEFFTAGPSLIDMLVAEIRRRRWRGPVQPARDRLRHRADHPVLADRGGGGVRLPVPADLRQHREPVHDQPAGAGRPPARAPAAGQRGPGVVRLGGAHRRPRRA